MFFFRPLAVEEAKTKFMSGLPGTVSDLPTSIQRLFQYVNSLEFQVI